MKNLRFMLKVVERIVFEQIICIWTLINLRSKYQSAFRCSHSMETALLKVFNEILCYLDESRSVMYVGLDLSAAFDIDHQFLFEILSKKIGCVTVY